MNSQYINDESASHIHFITNGVPTYVRIKNVANNTYLNVIEPDDISFDQTIICDDVGIFFQIMPSYNPAQFHLRLYTQVKNNCGANGWYLFTLPDSSLMKGAGKKDNKSTFILEKGTIGYYIRTLCTTANIYGDAGRYIYTTEDTCVHVDGDRSMSSAIWDFEKVNERELIKDVRTDYDTEFKQVMNTRVLSQLFKQTLKYVTIYNKAYNKIMSVYFNSPIYPTRNGVFGGDENTSFVVRPNMIDNSIYISYYASNVCYNLYTLPRNSKAYFGAPDCNWSKFYLIGKGNNVYMFQVFHRETDENGNYGRYLCMRPDNIDNTKYRICADGSADEECSHWTIV